MSPKNEKDFKIWESGFREGERHTKPSEKTLELILKQNETTIKMLEINQNHFKKDFDEGKEKIKKLKTTNILLGIIIFLLLAILGNF